MTVTVLWRTEARRFRDSRGRWVEEVVEIYDEEYFFAMRTDEPTPPKSPVAQV